MLEIIGAPNQLFRKYYKDYCIGAFDDFRERYWPCSYENKRERCISVSAGHDPKGHQSASGKIFAAGGYMSNFLWADLLKSWVEGILVGMTSIQADQKLLEFEFTDGSPDYIASRAHQPKMINFYDDWGDRFISHSICLSCLRELPEHPLTCGHVLCTPCVKMYGVLKDKCVVEISKCPLYGANKHSPRPSHIQVKPTLAGVRILCLDGYKKPPQNLN